MQYELRDGIARITLSRPERLNACGREMHEDLETAWLAFLEDADAQVAILTGSGRAFCSGRDIKEQLAGQPTERRAVRLEMPRHAPVCDKPIIAAINGLSAGMGNTMAFTADIRLASERASFVWSELATGMLGPFALAIEENLPWGLASSLMLSGEAISAQRAFEIGLVAKVVPHEQLLQEAERYARQLMALPTEHLRQTLRLAHAARPRRPEHLNAERVAWTMEHRNSQQARDAAAAALERIPDEGGPDGLSTRAP